MNWVFETIQDAIIASLERGPWLPEEFVITIPDEAMKVLLKGLVLVSNRKPVAATLKRVCLTIQECRVTVRSEADPEPWLPITPEEGLH